MRAGETRAAAVVRKHIDLIDDPGLLADPSGTWSRLREEAAAFHTDIPVPAWVLTRYEDIRDAFQRHDLFLSRSVTAYYEPPEIAGFRGMVGRLIPEELDPRSTRRIAIEEWHRRIPEYHVADPGAVRQHVAGVAGLDALPITFDETRAA